MMMMMMMLISGTGATGGLLRIWDDWTDAWLRECREKFYPGTSVHPLQRTAHWRLPETNCAGMNCEHRDVMVIVPIIWILYSGVILCHKKHSALQKCLLSMYKKPKSNRKKIIKFERSQILKLFAEQKKTRSHIKVFISSIDLKKSKIFGSFLLHINTVSIM